MLNSLATPIVLLRVVACFGNDHILTSNDEGPRPPL